MFKEKKCIKLADEIYVFKKYIPDNLIDKYLNIMNSYSPSEFEYKENFIEWYDHHLSPVNLNFIDLWEHVSELVYPDYYINPQTQMIRSVPGQDGMFPHCDSPGFGESEMLTQADYYKTCSIIDYGVVSYLGDFSGGEIFYHRITKDGKESDIHLEESEFLTYKPESGDVIIHSAYAPYYHGTKPVISGTRYAYSCFATAEKNFPNTYFKYKSKEYLENIKDRSEESLMKWYRPRNN